MSKSLQNTISINNLGVMSSAKRKFGSSAIADGYGTSSLTLFEPFIKVMVATCQACCHQHDRPWIHGSMSVKQPERGASNSIHFVSLLIGGPVQRFKSHLKSLRHHKFEHDIPGVRRTSRVRTPVGLQRQYKSCPQGSFYQSQHSSWAADRVWLPIRDLRRNCCHRRAWITSII